jgi:hypothetical protein
MGWGFLGDVVDAATDAAGDAWDAATDTVDRAVDTARDAADSAWSAVRDTVEGAGRGAWGVGRSAFGRIEDSFDDVVDVARGAGNAFLNRLDDTVLDTVDYLTAGTINVDYEDGEVSAQVGIDDIASVGVKVSSDGFSVDSESLLHDVHAGYDADTGFALSGEAGIKWGPLPYAEGHMQIDGDGNISIGGEVQGTIPTPYGVLSGSASGGFVRTDEGWGAYVEGDGTLYMPSGTTIRGGGGLRYQEDAEGNSQFGVNVHGSISEPGLGTIGGSAGYTRIEQDGVVLEQTTAEAHASGFGMSAEAGVEHTSITTDQGTISHTDTHADIDGFDADSLQQLGSALLGEDGGDVLGMGGQAMDVLGAGPGASDLIKVVQGVAGEQAAAVTEIAGQIGASDVGAIADDLGFSAPAMPEFEAPSTPAEPETELDSALDVAVETQHAADSMWEGVGDGMG